MGARIGRRVTFYPGVWILLPPGCSLEISDDVDLAKDVIVTASGGVKIGARSLVGYRTQILSVNHRLPAGQAKIFDAGSQPKPVVIEDDVWIGANCMILPGVTIGHGSVVAAGSVVTKSIQPFTIVGGVPARVIRRRNASRSGEDAEGLYAG
jgi:acetyltransferase-like isoleucine patch superfamily enzyme